MDLVLVMPAGSDVEESSEVARAFSLLGSRWIIPSRVDIARRVGGILTAAFDADLSFGALADDPSVAEGLRDASADALSRLIIPQQEPSRKTDKTDFSITDKEATETGDIRS